MELVGPEVADVAGDKIGRVWIGGRCWMYALRKRYCSSGVGYRFS